MVNYYCPGATPGCRRLAHSRNAHTWPPAPSPAGAPEQSPISPPSVSGSPASPREQRLLRTVKCMVERLGVSFDHHISVLRKELKPDGQGTLSKPGSSGGTTSGDRQKAK